MSEKLDINVSAYAARFYNVKENFTASMPIVHGHPSYVETLAELYKKKYPDAEEEKYTKERLRNFMSMKVYDLQLLEIMEDYVEEVELAKK